MKSRILKCIVAMAMAVSMMVCWSAGIAVEGEMAYNIYVEPDFTNKETGKTERLFDTYTIEFLSTKSPDATYWSLANFGMYISEQTKNKYRNISGGGAYAGLQDVGENDTAIMAFWEWKYKDGQEDAILRAHRIYPYGPESYFGGEGEGVNWITPFAWQDNQWYRIVLHCWTDVENGTTFVGEWFQDMNTGKWKLISYFDTMMINSCFEGNMHFFMENFSDHTAGEERDVQLKNIYAKLNSDKSWMSVDGAKLMHCNNWANNKIGKHSFGATQEYFWGQAGGFLEDGVSQEEYNASTPVSGDFQITQPAEPTFGDVSLEKVNIVNKDDKWYVKWGMDSKSTPQLSYQIVVKDGEGNLLYNDYATRPEIFYQELEGVSTDAFTCQVTVTDPFGSTTTLSESTERYKELYPEEDDVTDGGDESDEKKEKEDSGNLGMIIGIVAAVAVVVIGAVVVVVIIKKKKH